MTLRTLNEDRTKFIDLLSLAGSRGAGARPLVAVDVLDLRSLETLLVETLVLRDDGAPTVHVYRLDPCEGIRELIASDATRARYAPSVQSAGAQTLAEQLAAIRRDINPLRLTLLRGQPRVYFLRAHPDALDEITRSELLAIVAHIVLFELPWSIVSLVGDHVLNHLEPWSHIFRPATPQGAVLEAYVKRRLEELTLSFDPRQRDDIIHTVRGLATHDIDRLFSAISRQTIVSPSSFIATLREHRGKALREQVGVEVLAVEEESFGKIGGMELLKQYVRGDAEVLKNADDARAAGLRMPKGFVLVGLPGCGKSLAARLSAGVMGLPLLRLDLGGLMGKYLGESEKNLEGVLDSAQAQAPCVLWVDEMDKAFGSLVSDGSSATGQRMLGKLLTWMQDNDQGVYLIATANDVSKLPPELVRRGRFDELFFVDLPEPDQRLEILELKLRDARLDKKLDDATKKRLAHDTCDGYTGADIDALVSRTQRLFWLQQHDAPKPIDLATLFNDVAKGLVPLSHQFKSRIESMRQLFSEQGFLDVNDDPVRHGLRNFRSRQDLPRVLEHLLEHEDGAKLFDAQSGELLARVQPKRIDERVVLECSSKKLGEHILEAKGRALTNKERSIVIRAERSGDIELITPAGTNVLDAVFIDDLSAHVTAVIVRSGTLMLTKDSKRFVPNDTSEGHRSALSATTRHNLLTIESDLAGYRGGACINCDIFNHSTATTGLVEELWPACGVVYPMSVAVALAWADSIDFEGVKRVVCLSGAKKCNSAAIVLSKRSDSSLEARLISQSNRSSAGFMMLETGWSKHHVDKILCLKGANARRIFDEPRSDTILEIKKPIPFITQDNAAWARRSSLIVDL